MSANWCGRWAPGRGGWRSPDTCTSLLEAAAGLGLGLLRRPQQSLITDQQLGHQQLCRAPSDPQPVFTITEKDTTRAFSWLKAATTIIILYLETLYTMYLWNLLFDVF